MSDVNVQEVINNLSEQIRKLIVENAILQAQVSSLENAVSKPVPLPEPNVDS